MIYEEDDDYNVLGN